MKSVNQIYTVGPSGNVRVSPGRVAELSLVCAALKEAVGEDASWTLWQYRIGGTPHVALDVEGKSGAINWTIIVNENCKLPTTNEICLGREPLAEVFDSVDAFYLAEALIAPFRASASSVR